MNNSVAAEHFQRYEQLKQHNSDDYSRAAGGPDEQLEELIVCFQVFILVRSPNINDSLV